jgi:hypothetical protein
MEDDATDVICLTLFIGGGVGVWESGRPTVSRTGRLTLATLISVGRALEQEQEKVMRIRLAEEYMRGVKGGSKAGAGTRLPFSPT